MSENNQPNEQTKKYVKVVNIDEKNLHIFWATAGISMKLSEKIWVMIILRVTAAFLWKTLNI